MVIGFKCFNKGLVTSYGDVLEVGKEYISNTDPKFGARGFHFCINIEDSFRYFDCFNNEVDVCIILASGKIDIYNDEYNGYYDMGCCEKIVILEKLTREEVISIALNLNEIRVKRFVSTFGLTKNEIELFKNKFFYSKFVLDAISYYQEEDREVYKRTIDKKTYL